MASEKQVIILTEAASFQVKEMMVHNEEENASLRVAVKGGGCSGLSYGMAFDQANDEKDFFDEQHGIQIVVDKEGRVLRVCAKRIATVHIVDRYRRDTIR